MATQKTRKGYFDTDEGKEIKHKLQQMSIDDQYNTVSSYSANTLLYPDSLMPFLDKHMSYLMSHPAVEATKYVANIKLLTRIR